MASSQDCPLHRGSTIRVASLAPLVSSVEKLNKMLPVSKPIPLNEPFKVTISFCDLPFQFQCLSQKEPHALQKLGAES